jgi:hypothetical protein
LRECRRKPRTCRRTRSPAPSAPRRSILARRHRLIAAHRLARRAVAEAGPVAFALDRFVGDRALDDEDERIEITGVSLPPPLHEVVADLEVTSGQWNCTCGRPGSAHRDVLDARCIAAVSATESPSQLTPR